MKKEQIIKSMLFLIIPLLVISCDGNGFMEYEETALMQRDAQQGLLSDEAALIWSNTKPSWIPLIFNMYLSFLPILFNRP